MLIYGLMAHFSSIMKSPLLFCPRCLLYSTSLFSCPFHSFFSAILLFSYDHFLFPTTILLSAQSISPYTQVIYVQSNMLYTLHTAYVTTIHQNHNIVQRISGPLDPFVGGVYSCVLTVTDVRRYAWHQGSGHRDVRT